MPKTEARLCPFTDRIIQDDAKYACHLRRLRKLMRKERERKRLRAQYHTIMNRCRNEVDNIGDIGKWIVDNQQELIAAYNSENDFSKFGRSFEITSIELERIRFSDMCSNSHSAPLGKQENWCGTKKGVPRGYPGYCGSIIINSHNDRYGGFAVTGLLKELRVMTGTGGKGYGSSQYEFTIWHEDWPLIREADVWKKLEGC